jgi:hypothetical protein
MVDELAIDAHKYTKKDFYEAINIAITNLKLIQLCDQLAKNGFARFNRFVDPITNQLATNNVLETELLPTIAMLILQKNGRFIEYPLTVELQGKSPEDIQTIKEMYANKSCVLKNIIDEAIEDMHRPSLMRLIKISQQNLMTNLFTASRKSLAPDVQGVLNKRDTNTPEHVLNNSISFFSNTQQKMGNKTESTEELGSTLSPRITAQTA